MSWVEQADSTYSVTYYLATDSDTIIATETGALINVDILEVTPWVEQSDQATVWQEL